jgi:DNA polymerase-3 subunit alpha
MAIVYFEDLEGIIETVVYPKVFEKLAPHIQQDFIGFIEGRVEIKEDNPKMIVNDLVPFEEASRRYAKSIHIQMQPEKAKSEDLEKLREELTHVKGDCPVYLSFSFPNGGKVVVSTSADFKVQPTPKVIHRLKEIFGGESVLIKRNKLEKSDRNRFSKGSFRNRVQES